MAELINKEFTRKVLRFIEDWTSGSYHFQDDEEYLFQLDEEYSSLINEIKEIYPEVIYNGTCYRKICFGKQHIGDINISDEELPNYFKNNIIKGYGKYQAFSKNPELDWGNNNYKVSITGNNCEALDLNALAKAIGKEEVMWDLEDQEEVIAVLTKDMNVEVTKNF